jgi:hypothetical protein
MDSPREKTENRKIICPVLCMAPMQNTRTYFGLYFLLVVQWIGRIISDFQELVGVSTLS